MIIVTRHATKTHTYKSNVENRYDARITRRGIIKTKRLLTDLTFKYGKIDRVICSPYLRCIETSHILCDNITIDSNLSEHIPFTSKVLEGYISKETLSYNPPVDETKAEFNHRMSQFYKSMIERESQDVLIIVTHGYCINTLKKLDQINNKLIFV